MKDPDIIRGSRLRRTDIAAGVLGLVGVAALATSGPWPEVVGPLALGAGVMLVPRLTGRQRVSADDKGAMIEANLLDPREFEDDTSPKRVDGDSEPPEAHSA